MHRVYEVIGEVIPLAAGLAISPFPIIAAILMLLSPRSVTTSLGFLSGWLAGIAQHRSTPLDRGQGTARRLRL